jgi:hypothetical protein
MATWLGKGSIFHAEFENHLCSTALGTALVTVTHTIKTNSFAGQSYGMTRLVYPRITSPSPRYQSRSNFYIHSTVPRNSVIPVANKECQLEVRSNFTFICCKLKIFNLPRSPGVPIINQK